jgi:hypothetical protein
MALHSLHCVLIPYLHPGYSGRLVTSPNIPARPLASSLTVNLTSFKMDARCQIFSPYGV